MDPNAVARARQRHALLRAHAFGVHPGSGRRRLVDSRPDGPVGRSAPRARRHPGAHGPGGPPVPPGLLRRLLRRGGLAGRHPLGTGRRICPVQPRPLRARPARDAPGHRARWDDAPRDHRHAPAVGSRRIRDRPRVCGQHDRIGRGRGDRRAHRAPDGSGLKGLLMAGATLDLLLGLWLLERSLRWAGGTPPSPRCRGALAAAVLFASIGLGLQSRRPWSWEAASTGEGSYRPR
jgi:hypothetical protein